MLLSLYDLVHEINIGQKHYDNDFYYVLNYFNNIELNIHLINVKDSNLIYKLSNYGMKDHNDNSFGDMYIILKIREDIDDNIYSNLNNALDVYPFNLFSLL